MKHTPQEIAESFINGNLLLVKEQCKKDIVKVAEVITCLKEVSEEEANRFIKWVLMW